MALTERADLVRPQTYMNRSGFALQCLVERYRYPADQILVVYDEIDLPLGALRLRPKGSPGGHRGLESVVACLRTDRIARLRLGIAPDIEVGDLADFVLDPFDLGERDLVERQIVRAADACESWLDDGVSTAMSSFNGPTPDEP